MKKRILIILALISILMAFLVTGCSEEPQTGAPGQGGDTNTPSVDAGNGGETNDNTKPPVNETYVKVADHVGSDKVVALRDAELASFDFTTLFSISDAGKAVAVNPAYIDMSELSSTPGDYVITCQWGGMSASVTIRVSAYTYKISLTEESISVKMSDALNYDYNALFTIKDNEGVVIPVTDDMVTSTVKAEVGSYTYTVTCGNATATLTVRVTQDHILEVMTSYRNLGLTSDAVLGYDMTELFSLFVDGTPVRVTSDMLDTSAVPTTVENIKLGDTYTVTLSYTTEDGRASISKSTTITVVAASETVLAGKNLDVYINATPIDLTTLFSITRAGESIAVTEDMISGSINYTKSGNYKLILTYMGESTEATVRVVEGVVLGYSKADTLTVKQGTDIATYPFAEDFTVVINGVRFTQFPLSYLDLSEVDFSVAGVYPVKLTVPYNEKKPGLTSKPTPINYEFTINYVVVENDYTLTVTEENVLLNAGTTQYNVFSNLKLRINGRNCGLTDDQSKVSVLACYAKLLSAPIDFASRGVQTVRIAVYVNGVDAPPVEISYTLRIESGIKVSATGTAVFTGSPLYVNQLFSITDSGKEIEVTTDMVNGKVDVFTPGIYHVSLVYEGIVCDAEVVVLDRQILGTYKTLMTTVPTYKETDDEEASDVLVPGTRLGELVINEDGSVTFGRMEGRLVGGDTNNLTVMCGINEYTFHYDNGVMVLDPENSLGMAFNDYKRPLLYFHTDVYEVQNLVTINYSDNYVLMNDAYGGAYSIDTVKVRNLTDNTEFWYGLKVKLITKSSSDHFYEVTWGEAEYPEQFQPIRGTVSTLTFEGVPYEFTMTSGVEAKVNKNDDGALWKNTDFTGTYNGSNAILRVDNVGNITLLVNGRIVFKVYPGMTYSGRAVLSAAESTALLYDFTGREGYGLYSDLFRLDTTAKTFTIDARDQYYGLYKFGNMYFYLDGYGTGHFSDDPTTYTTTRFTYAVENGILTAKFFDTDPRFAYGDSVSFYVSPLLNLLTVREFEGANVAGQTFVNSIITDGAIVTIGTATLPSYETNDLGKTALLNQITIITKDGELSIEEKRECLSTAPVDFTTAGFYLYTLKIQVSGVEVSTKYTIQILPKTYENSSIAVAWQTGLLSDTSLAIDAWGRVTFMVAGNSYTGIADVTDTGFTAFVYNVVGERIGLRGTVTDGIMTLRGTGGVNVNDIYTIGSVRVAGASGAYLRAITYDGITIYYLAERKTELGRVVTITSLNDMEITANGVILSLTDGDDQVTIVRVDEWGNDSTGVSMADAHRGIYTLADNADLTIDGFGNATLGNLIGTYVMHSAVATVTFAADDVRLYHLLSDMTYRIVETAQGEALVAGKTYTGEYAFSCGYYPYNANTSFAFLAGGKVIVRSTSDEHDTGSDACTDDSYAPTFANKTGMEGTYTVIGDHVTVSVGGETFVFHITNLQSADEIVCESTTLASDAHGQFPVSTSFACHA